MDPFVKINDLFIPWNSLPELRNKLEAEAIYEMSLEQRYQNDTVFRIQSDLLHERRMMSGPACVNCMERVALRR